MKIQLLIALSCFYAPTEVMARTLDYDSLVKVSRSYCESGKADKALGALDRAIKRAPNRPDAYVVQGFAFALKKEFTESIAAYEKGRALGSTDRRLFVELATLYDAQEQYKKATGVHRAWLTIQPNDQEVRHELGLTLILAGDLPNAIIELKNVVKALPKKGEPKRDLAYAYASGGHHELAFPLVEQAFPTSMPLPVLMDFIQTYSDPDLALGFFNRFARRPFDPAHQRIEAHLKKLTAP